MSDLMRLDLFYGQVLVGEIADAFAHQGTWFGQFRQALADGDGPIARRVREYIAFSDEWHARMRAEQPHDASEFDAFREILASGLWHTRTADGVDSPIVDAPIFMEGEISWLPADPQAKAGKPPTTASGDV